ncbi:CAAX prenyl protease [Exophiala xenobiotica]|uniref:intramembrane prenyl-peptidase Rce1 n=1 Tax=Vermiconidia calcicola TaxID=1690605 RepID=A0AAV9Q0N4_9PEZI|nr:CAAX prenyl protease [Exophiala xenobiotica]KAK5532832.1 CAAX prenyl protease [Vermiconidia calcicola]KAK5546561.1 CAAX prenyl protease [Chaetothyriales sp. CCFEE 6169]KAK5270091.1 CAAX prenyl protease [Exophiala xenobiotica]KAK5296801.1 CAAX prenyl protease [Exophiala xenobiotica]
MTTEEEKSIISTTTTAALSVAFTLIYVIPFYLSRSTRPSPSLNRDAPSVIRARIRTVTLACIVASSATFYLLVVTARLTPFDAFHLMGWWPIQVIDVVKCCALTLLLFLGPVFEKLFVEGHLHDLRRGQKLVETLKSWQGYRNYVAGPVTEEVIFRSVLVPLHLLAKVSPTKIVFLTPLYFGIAHVHHFYEFTLTHPHTPLLPALLRSVFQFGYTTLFGWIAGFIYLRTGSIYACIAIHTFCNWVGLPRFWGRVQSREEYPPSPVAMRGKDDTDAVQAQGTGGPSGLKWTVAYYVLLLAGVSSFYAGLWPLTASSLALADFGGKKTHRLK